MAYKHIVLFKIYNEVPDEKYQEALRTLRLVGEKLNLSKYMINESIDTRKGRGIIEEVEFESEAEYLLFKDSSEHKNAGVLMREMSDWIVGDYLT